MLYTAHYGSHSQDNPVEPSGIGCRISMTAKLDPALDSMTRQPFLLRQVCR
ncbi:hypothetical protein [Actimicrobium sp. CCI2.3]|uniref:hypothetical protein n=1 Tax=Actimicrobium sp. CCI2.3 TaxID=3048616 RepID=UPI002AB3C1D9|nr:hypothetical protein [Actimicrobium sp. CCI2.3]MDY7573940.1 hypothetical protein [Actimicrobium sp. CCI2.3]MEB0023072.1 hypothetical protein [Actimicrobium sp. CCI2.3]